VQALQKKIPVEFDGQRGLAAFPHGVCELWVEDGQLCFTCQAADQDSIERLRYVVEMHVAMFSRRVPLKVKWTRWSA